MLASRCLALALVVTPLLSLLPAPQDGAAGAAGAGEPWVCPPCGADCHDRLYEGPGKCLVCGMDLAERSSITQVAVLVFEDCDLASWAPAAAAFSRSSQAFLSYVSDTTDPLKTLEGIEIVPTHTLGQAPAPDVILVAGGWGALDAAQDELFVDWLRRSAEGARFVILSGAASAIAAPAGLLEGLEVPAPEFIARRLKESYPELALTSEPGLLDHGKLKIARDGGQVTGLALSALAEIGGGERARRVAADLGLEPPASEER